MRVCPPSNGSFSGVVNCNLANPATPVLKRSDKGVAENPRGRHFWGTPKMVGWPCVISKSDVAQNGTRLDPKRGGLHGGGCSK